MKYLQAILLFGREGLQESFALLFSSSGAVAWKFWGVNYAEAQVLSLNFHMSTVTKYRANI